MLVLGGTSSLAHPFLQLALDEGYEITATSRKESNLMKHPHIHWENLNLDSEKSVLNFIDSINRFKFQFIFDFIGKTSSIEEHEIDLLKLKKYFS